MKRLLALVIAVLVFSGCRAQAPPAADPFFGRTRVTPPGTGAISAGPADPYYQGTPGVVVPQTPAGTIAPPAVSIGVPSDTPPSGGFDNRGSSSPGIRIPSPSQPGTRVPPPSFVEVTPAPSSQAAQTPAATGTLAGRERVIRILEPRPRASEDSRQATDGHPTVAAAPGEPRRLGVATRAVDIMELPEAGTSRSASSDRTAPDSAGFRLVSGTGPADDSAGVTAAVGSSLAATNDAAAAAEFAPRAGYGYDLDYAWVRGKLEYSEIDRCWKLRYIPVDGETDRYGGSMALPDASVLTGCERGDFVEIHGRVGHQDLKKGYAPTYEVAEVKRLK